MKNLNLNKLLLSMSYVQDFIEMDLIGVFTNHSRRVAYISLAIAKKIKLSEEECFDIVALAILHDNGLTEKSLKTNSMLDLPHEDELCTYFKTHCIVGEKNTSDFPFLTEERNIIKYHHERYDGSGLFKLKGDEIPIMAQIISFANNLDNKFNLKEIDQEKERHIIKYVEKKRGVWFSSDIVDSFHEIINLPGIHMDLKDDYILIALDRVLQSFEKNMTYAEVRKVTRVFSKMIDSKSYFTSKHSQDLSIKIGEMSDYYGKDSTEKIKLLIAADLHDIGKVNISNQILDKPSSLTYKEFRVIKNHSYYTRVCLEPIDGFELITRWASNHHEKLDGSGYPYGLKSEDLDFNSRLMACLDIYQALTEDRPYRDGFSHGESMVILKDMVSQGLIDKEIVEDIELVFKTNK